MAKLNQILAVRDGIKSRTYAAITEIDKRMRKEDLLSGISRTYRPKDEDGDQLPDETKLVQVAMPDVIADLRAQLEEVWNITATAEYANTSARADITLDDGTVVLESVPVLFLLPMEKQLTDHRTMVSRMPVLDPAEHWAWDPNANAYKADVHETTKTRKVPKAFVAYDATPEHPAQVQVFQEDEIVGTWATTKYSGALPAARRAELIRHADDLLKAVKKAREAANDMDVTNQIVAGPLLDYLLS